MLSCIVFGAHTLHLIVAVRRMTVPTEEPLLMRAIRSDCTVQCLFARSNGPTRDSSSKKVRFGILNIR
jgi:hypothetical protein